jgi:hypothetical protein
MDDYMDASLRRSNITVIVAKRNMYKLSVGTFTLAIFVALSIMIITHVGKDKYQNLMFPFRQLPQRHSYGCDLLLL